MRRKPAQASVRDAGDDFWYTAVAPATVAAGVPVTVAAAMSIPVVSDCIKVLAETVASLPLHLYERTSAGAVKALQHPLYDVLHDRPNDVDTAFEFWAQMVHDLCGTHGNCFAEIVPGPRGFVDRLVRLDPNTVTVSRIADGTVRYEICESGMARRLLVAGEVWHLRLPPFSGDGLLGTSPIFRAREAIGAALALQQYGARFFANDATPPFIIEHPAAFKDDQSKENFLKAIKRWWGGRNKGSPGVLEYGMKATKLGVNNEEAQFLDTRKEHNLDLCRIWRVPPHKVGILDRATFSNIEHQSLEFVSDTILPILRMIEAAISRDLILAPRKYYAEFNVDGLLRGDLKSRYEAYAVGRNWGFLSTNDIRRKENMNPIAGGDDDYLQPLNMIPAGTPPEPPAAPGARARAFLGERIHAPSL